MENMITRQPTVALVVKTDWAGCIRKFFLFFFHFSYFILLNFDHWLVDCWDSLYLYIPLFHLPAVLPCLMTFFTTNNDPGDDACENRKTKEKDWHYYRERVDFLFLLWSLFWRPTPVIFRRIIIGLVRVMIVLVSHLTLTFIQALFTFIEGNWGCCQLRHFITVGQQHQSP